MLATRPGFLSAVVLCAVLLSACGSSTAPEGSGGGSGAIKVLSNRADLISGDDALVEIVLSSPATAPDVVVKLNGANVTAQFGLRENDRYMGRVTGLRLGRNTLTASLPGGKTDSYTLINHPNGGPVFSGPQVQPWTCNNAAATDAQCNQPAEYTFLYKSTNPAQSGLQPYDPDAPATDVAMTTTQGGVAVPFIVRQELGYQDRDQYKILMLFQPDQPWEPWAPQEQWNRKLVITHGGSCGVSYQSGDAPLEDYSGTIPATPALEQSYIVALGMGFAVASTALDNTGHNCNLVTEAESLVMVKERLIEQYGELRYTIGTGCSGGSIAQHHIANAYPGVYQGLLPTCSYPDVFTTAVQFAEYHLLRIYFEDPSRWAPGVLWTPTQFADVEGHLSHLNAVASDEAFFKGATNPSNPDCSGVPAPTIYNAATNPGGLRCGVSDYMINVFGPRLPAVWEPNEQMLNRGFAGLPVDNIGVQYGLSALRAGLILPSQFVDVNQKIGGLTIDIQQKAERTRADEPALARAYRTGAINTVTHLDKVAIIDGRGPDPGIAHDVVHTYALRARLDREHGHHDNQAIWEGPIPLIGDVKYTVNGLIAMDRWLEAVELDVSDTPLPQKILDNKPADIGDACYNGSGVKLSDGICGPAVVPIYGTPRTVAGDAIATDTNKCQLKPLNRADDYGAIGFSDAEWAQLQAIFPEGVCDFTKPAVSKQDTIAWQTYQKANGDVIYGGTPLPTAPAASGSGWASPAFGIFR